MSSREGEQQSEVPAPTLSSYSWDLLAEQVEMTPWSIAAREAGLWSLERLQAEFGPRWPPAWREPGGMPAEIASCFWALAGLCGTISLALAFERLKGAEGLSVLRKAIKRGTDQGRFASLRLQVRQGALARSAGLDVALEPLLPGGETKADLLIRGKGTDLAVEALSVLRDRRTMNGSAWLDGVRDELRRIGEKFYVDFEGTVDAPLGAEETVMWLDEVRRYAQVCAQGVSLPPLTINGVTIAVKAARPGGGSRFQMPTVSHGERLGLRLAGKAKQTKRSGAQWLLIDSLDHLWHMKRWSQQSLAQKGEQLVDLFRHELRDAEHLAGVVITDGAALMRPAVPEQTVERREFTALLRRSDTWHIRESVILPLRPGGEDAFPVALHPGCRVWMDRERAAS